MRDITDQLQSWSTQLADAVPRTDLDTVVSNATARFERNERGRSDEPGGHHVDDARLATTHHASGRHDGGDPAGPARRLARPADSDADGR
jgi:hypothetical protein